MESDTLSYPTRQAPALGFGDVLFYVCPSINAFETYLNTELCVVAELCILRTTRRKHRSRAEKDADAG